MKKNKVIITLALLLMVAIIVTGCNNSGKNEVDDSSNEELNQEQEVASNEDEPKEDPEKDAEVEPQLEEDTEDEDVNLDELKETIEMNIGEDDTLKDVKYEGNDIFIEVLLDDDGVFEPKDLAISRYSSITDELLENPHWENISVEFTNVGIITMNTNQAVENEYGKYFDSLDIEQNIQ